MSLVALNPNHLDSARTRVDRLFNSEKIDEVTRDRMMATVNALPSLLAGEVYVANGENDAQSFSELLEAGIFETFTWVNKDVEYSLGMCEGAYDALDFAEDAEELADKDFFVYLQEYATTSIPDIYLDMVSKIWGRYIFSIVVVDEQ